jgi:hypothetical protein
MIESGEIKEVFLKVYYGDKIIIGDLDDAECGGILTNN